MTDPITPDDPYDPADQADIALDRAGTDLSYGRAELAYGYALLAVGRLLQAALVELKALNQPLAEADLHVEDFTSPALRTRLRIRCTYGITAGANSWCPHAFTGDLAAAVGWSYNPVGWRCPDHKPPVDPNA